MHCWFVQVGRGCGVCALGFPFLRTLCVCGARFLSLTSYICHCCMAVFVPVALPLGRSGRVLHADTYGRGKVSIGSFCNAYFCTAVHPFNAHRCCVQLSLVYVQTCREHDDLPFCIRLDTARARFEVAVGRAENTVSLTLQLVGGLWFARCRLPLGLIGYGCAYCGRMAVAAVMIQRQAQDTLFVSFIER